MIRPHPPDSLSRNAGEGGPQVKLVSGPLLPRRGNQRVRFSIVLMGRTTHHPETEAIEA